MISLEEARERLFASITPLEPERVPLLEAIGRYCVESVESRIDLPRFDNSAMDGYAVRCEDLKSATPEQPVMLKLLGRIGAGEAFGATIAPGTCLRLFTGSVLPMGADAVVMQEAVRAENGIIHFLESVKPFENVRLAGEDIREGKQIATPGEKLTTTQLSLFAATGHADVAVRKFPRVAVIATGDELIEPGELLAAGKIYESNRTLVTSLLRALHIPATVLPILRDDFQKTTAGLKEAFTNHDLVITTGGVSVGEFDFVKDAFSNLGGVIDHWKVAIRPGKPFVFGKLQNKFLFGLPGNPVSTLVTFLVLVRPALLKLLGARETELPQVTGKLAEAIANPGDRRHFVRCAWSAGRLNPAGRQASHMIGALAAANCLLDIPPATRLEAGTEVSAYLWELPLV